MICRLYFYSSAIIGTGLQTISVNFSLLIIVLIIFMFIQSFILQFAMGNYKYTFIIENALQGSSTS